MGRNRYHSTEAGRKNKERRTKRSKERIDGRIDSRERVKKGAQESLANELWVDNRLLASC